MTKILIFTAHDEKFGGRAIFDLRKKLEGLDYEVSIVTKVKNKKYNNCSKVVGIYSNASVQLSRIYNYVLKLLFPKYFVKKNPRYYFFVQNQKKGIKTNKLFQAMPFIPDYILISFYDTFLSIKDIYMLKLHTNAKMVFWLHDMITFSGGCHYSNFCLKYTSHCGMCPALYSYKEKDHSYYNFEFKKNYLSQLGTEVYLVDSTNTKNQVKSSAILKNENVDILMHSVDEKIYTYKYAVIDYEKEKREYSQRPKRILFVAKILTEERKGFQDFVKVMNHLALRYYDNFEAIIIGENIEKFSNNLIFKHKAHGKIVDEQKMSELFRTSDFYISNSYEDTGPGTVKQSICCGTPVLAYNVGIAGDLIENNRSGFLFNIGDFQGMIDCLNRVMAMDFYEIYELAKNSREIYMKKACDNIYSNKLKTIFHN